MIVMRERMNLGTHTGPMESINNYEYPHTQHERVMRTVATDVCL